MLSWFDFAVDVLNLGAVAYVIYSYRGLRQWIGSLHSDMSRPKVTPELIQGWKRKIASLEPGTARYKAYEASLKAAGADWP